MEKLIKKYLTECIETGIILEQIDHFDIRYEKLRKKLFYHTKFLSDLKELQKCNNEDVGRKMKEVVIKFNNWKENHPSSDVDEFLEQEKLTQY
jgi:hypothetical protein